MTATVRADYYGGSGSEPAGVTAETGIVFSQSDAEAPASGTAPVVKPAATGSAYSYIMLLALDVTGTSATDISARKIYAAASYDAGTGVFWGTQDTYRQPAGSNQPPATITNGPTVPTPTGSDAPASYALVTTSATTWDAASVSAGSTGRNGDFVELVFGLDFTFGGDSGRQVNPDLYLAYTES